MKNIWPGLWTAANRRFYWDEMYQWVTHTVIFGCICRGIAWFDRHIIDGTMDGLAAVTQFCSVKIKGMQSGSVQTYVAWYLLRCNPARCNHLDLYIIIPLFDTRRKYLDYVLAIF